MRANFRNVRIVGGGLIGLALARELHRRGARVEVHDAGDAGAASWAGAGMLAARMCAPGPLRDLALASADMYANWAAELERETYLSVGYRPSGTLVLGEGAALPAEWEPGLAPCVGRRIAEDHSVDNRALHAALLASVRARGIPLRSGRVGEVVVGRGEVVINAAGAWAGQVAAPFALPVRPRKGQMLCLRTPLKIRHVIEAPEVYLVPRNDGRVLVGATLEDVGFDAEVSRERLDELRRRAVAVVPGLAGAEWTESWCGYRPGTPDDLPLLGPTPVEGYWAATGHYRDGILLTPITAQLVADALLGGAALPAAFAPTRFGARSTSGI